LGKRDHRRRRKALQKRIVGLQEMIQEHQQKLAEERAKPHPNARLIAYWEKEIRVRQKEIERLQMRLRLLR
jgi:peptidoglycan hydrolase CwlO-like protein